MMGNTNFQNLFPGIEIEYLGRSGSDHAPLLITCKNRKEEVVKPFKFLNFSMKKNHLSKLLEEIGM